ncbi:hypothetical protein ID866_7603 [Astraeus odoratus]|nr:hypothetical protein ID866_7603 [Astraeus odoratus]
MLLSIMFVNATSGCRCECIQKKSGDTYMPIVCPRQSNRIKSECRKLQPKLMSFPSLYL